jgi:hypothetical protein
VTPKMWNIEQKILCVIILIFAVFFLLPIILFRTNSIITIHDNLDSLIPFYKMYHDNGLYFKFDVPTKGFSEMSTLYYNYTSFSITPLLFYLLDDFIALTINIYIGIYIGFFSMYLLLKKIRNMDATLIILISICFAILPVIPTCNFTINTLPLIITVFIHFAFTSPPWKIFYSSCFIHFFHLFQ